VIDWEKGVSSPTGVQLAALAKERMDVLYVLTGIRARAHQQLGSVKQASMILEQLGAPKDVGAELLPILTELMNSAPLGDREARMLDLFRRCAQPDQDVLLQMADRMAVHRSADQSDTKKGGNKK
jgi:hypothetical protein